MTSTAKSRANEPNPPANHKSHVRRQAILEQTWQLISSRGYQATSVNTIIAELGISKGSFYHHFDSKEAVFTALVERLTQESSQRAAQDNACADAAERLCAFTRAGWQWHEAHQQVSTEITRVLLRPENAELLDRIMTTEARVVAPWLDTIIEQGVTEGVFDVDDVQLTTKVLLPMVMEFDLRPAREALAGDVDIKEFLHQLRFMQQAVERLLGAVPGALLVIALWLLLTTALRAETAAPPTSDPTPTEEDAAVLIEQVLERTRGLTSYSELSMTVHRPKWERSSTLKAWTRGETDSLIRFTAPAREAGNGTLKAGKQMWTYTPKLNRVIRLPSSMMAQSWGGSDFSYNDLSRSDELNEYFDHALDVSEQHEGHTVYTITSTPHADAPVVWGKQELKIRDDIVLLEQTFFDQDMQPLKRMTGYDIKDVGDGRIIATRLRMVSLEEDDHWTELIYNDIDFNVELNDRLFTQFSLKNP